MGDSYAALKRHMAAMEAALSTLTTELAEVQDRIATLEGGSDSALAVMVAAVTVQASAMQAQADATRAAAEARTKPGMLDITDMSPARATCAFALALAGRPAMGAGTGMRDSWHAA